MTGYVSDPPNSGDGAPAPRNPLRRAAPAETSPAETSPAGTSPEVTGPSGTAFIEDPSRPALVHGRDLPAGAQVSPHAHPRAQLLQAETGLLRVTSGDDSWLVPPGFGVWIPGNVPHAVTVETAARTRNIYIDPSLPLRQATGCEVLPVSPLLRQVLARMREEGDPDRFARLGAVACDEIALAEAAPLDLPAGRDPRLRRITLALGRHPEDPRGLVALAAMAGASPRTVERLFRAETGFGYRQWRVRARLIGAVARLERGESTTEIAHSMGYAGVSAFAAAFRRQFGCAPQAYLRGPAVAE